MKRLIRMSVSDKTLLEIQNLSIDLLSKFKNKKAKDPQKQVIYDNIIQELEQILIDDNFKNYNYETFSLKLNDIFNKFRGLTLNSQWLDKMYRIKQKFLDDVNRIFDEEYIQEQNNLNNKNEDQMDDDLICNDCLRKQFGRLHENFNEFARFMTNDGTCSVCGKDHVTVYRLI